MRSTNGLRSVRSDSAIRDPSLPTKPSSTAILLASATSTNMSREQGRAAFGSTPRIFEDYRDLIKRSDIDVILIGTPDHWHTKMIIDAVRAGKDVYCEKPLTLTIDEGKLLTKCRQGNRPCRTGRILATKRQSFPPGHRTLASGAHWNAEEC